MPLGSDWEAAGQPLGSHGEPMGEPLMSHWGATGEALGSTGEAKPLGGSGGWGRAAGEPLGRRRGLGAGRWEATAKPVGSHWATIEEPLGINCAAAGMPLGRSAGEPWGSKHQVRG